ncbi:MAG: hypothetical protein LVR00_05560 [Rhabdochlamydiaceae bacterium]
MNARAVEEKGAAVVCVESQLNAKSMGELVKENIDPKRLEEMRASIASYKDESKEELSDIIYAYLTHLTQKG